MAAIEFTAEEREALGEALDLAYDDQNHYLDFGSPSVDYGAEWPEAAALKAVRFRHLAEVGEKLGFHGERERWTALAESVEASVAGTGSEEDESVEE